STQPAHHSLFSFFHPSHPPHPSPHSFPTRRSSDLIHVRDLETKQGSREVAHYREVVRRIRAADVDPVINLTAGMGGDLVVDPQDPLTTMPGTDLINALDRLPHVEELLPEICTI